MHSLSKAPPDCPCEKKPVRLPECSSDRPCPVAASRRKCAGLLYYVRDGAQVPDRCRNVMSAQACRNFRNTRDADGLSSCRSPGVTHREQEGPQSYPLPRLPGHCGPRFHVSEKRSDGQVERERAQLVYHLWLRSRHLKRRMCLNPTCRRIAFRLSPATHCRIPRSSRLIAVGISLSESPVKRALSAPDARLSICHVT